MAKSGLHSGVRRGRLVDTIGAFLEKRMGYGGSVQTSGKRLYSYMVAMGEWDGEAVRLLNSHRIYSRTTNRHRNMLVDMAASKGIRIIE